MLIVTLKCSDSNSLWCHGTQVEKHCFNILKGLKGLEFFYKLFSLQSVEHPSTHNVTSEVRGYLSDNVVMKVLPAAKQIRQKIKSVKQSSPCTKEFMINEAGRRGWNDFSCQPLNKLD